MRRHLIPAILAFSLLAPHAIAQAIPNPANASGPSLVAYSNGIHSDASKREMRVALLDIHVVSHGDLAETTITGVFENPTNELLEGQFSLNMTRGAVVTGYALDINGTLVDGVLEGKYKAAEAYQRRVSRRIDPGLAEVTYADRFETRIYPIPAKGARTIRLRMVSLYDPAEGYVLPLTLPAEIGRLKLSVEGDARLVALPEGLKGEGASFEAGKVRLKGALKLAAPKQVDALQVSEHPGAERFFEINTAVAADSAVQAAKAPLHIFWDRSVSRSNDALKVEAQLAADYAARRGLSRVTLTLFDSGRTETEQVDVDKLVQRLGKVHYRGGTSYAVLQGVPIMGQSECLMFSDGRVSLDDRKSFGLRCRLSAVASGPEVDRAWLADVAERSGGVFVELGKDSRAALARLTRPEIGVLAVTDSAGKPIDVVRLPARMAGASMVHLVGPLPDDGAVLVSLAGEPSVRRFKAPDRARYFAGPGAIWASRRIGAVAADMAPDQLAMMARRYNVATPQASFVVLESPNDYVEARIVPPDSYPKALRAQYDAMFREKERDDRLRREERVGEVASLWKAQQAWWTTKFDGKSKAEPKRAAARAGGPPIPDVAIPAPAPRASNEQAEMARAAPSADSDKVVVTASMIMAERDRGAPVEIIAERELKADAGGGNGRAGSIEVAGWSADRPYLARLDKAGAEWEAAIDKEMAKPEGAIPLFWFDVAEWHWKAGRKDEARRAVEAALDLPTRDSQTLAIVAARLVRYGGYDRAVWLLEKLSESETDRPQPSRTLALALIERAKAEAPDRAKADLSRAIGLLVKAATEVYDVEAVGIEAVSLMEANGAQAKLKALGGKGDVLDGRFIGLMQADVRVVVEWNTPRTDLDLWVTEPAGAKVGYSSPLSPWGGKLSGDVTDGYGPEEYMVRDARPGVYQIRAKTFASDRSNPNGPSVIAVRLIRNFGRPDQSEQLIDLEMPAEDRGEREIGRITVK